MKKIISVILVSLFVLGGINSFAIANSDPITTTKTAHMDISEPQILTNGNYCSIIIPEQAAYVMDAGKPMVPFMTRTFTFPIGTIIDDVTVRTETKQFMLTSKIEPAPNPMVLSSDLPISYQPAIPDVSVYQSEALYPETSFTIQKGVGLSNDEHVVIVTVKCYSQYAPALDTLDVPVSIDITVDYQAPTVPVIAETSVQLLIITDETFAEALQPLVDHKISMGISTKLETVQEIYPAYNGKADWEDVKLRIANAVQTLGTEFVLLAGGHKGQTNEWWVPDFRSKNYDDNGIGDMDLTYSSDLYFADVFRYDNMGTAMFEDWDTNNDGIYAEGPYYSFGGYDKPDYYPDVAVGRVPFRYSWEVPIVVDKIITYETTAYGQDWSKRAILCGGDTSPEERYPGDATFGIYEGELTCDDAAGYLVQAGYDITRLYTSMGITSPDQVAENISKGCGWVTMEMHSNPATGGSHITDKIDFARFYSILHMDLFQNDNMYPFMANDGCHNAQFDVTMQHVFDHGGFEGIEFSWYEWIPCDASSWFVLKEQGGAVGVIGNTALGYGYLNQYYGQGLGGWIQPRFAHAHAVQGKEYAGTIWAQALTDYIDNFPVLTDIVDRKTIEERVLIGDPSLKLGGYPIGTAGTGDNPDEPSDPTQNTLGLVDTPEWTQGMSWTYRIDDIEFAFSEIPGRSIDLTLNAGDITFTIDSVDTTSYTTTVQTSDLDVFIDLDVNFSSDELPTMVGTAHLVNSSLTGTMHFDKSTLGFQDIHLVFNGEIETASLIPNFNFDIPAFILKLVPLIPFTVNLDVTFDDPYQLLNYPLELGKGWGLPAATITIDGTVTSKYFKIISILDRLAGLFGRDLLPSYIADLLPVIDISELFETLGMSNVMEIAELDNLFDEHTLKVRTEEDVTVEAGTFTTYNIWFFVGAGELFYAPDVDNIVKIDANVNRYIPYMDTISLDLVSYTHP